MAEMISLNFPKIVELHNYPPGNSVRSKINNWNTLNGSSLFIQEKFLANWESHSHNKISKDSAIAPLWPFRLFSLS